MMFSSHCTIISLPLLFNEVMVFSQPLLKELAEMEKVNSQLSIALEEVTREHREKAEVHLNFYHFSEKTVLNLN